MRKGRLRRLRGLDETLTAQPGHLLVGVLRIPEEHGSPIRVITRRVAIALVVLFGAAVIVYLDRNGYRDLRGRPLTFLDSLYYAAVSLSTTGYGDITALSETSRLINIVVMTPEVMILLGAVPTTVGSSLNSLRSKLVKAVLTDAQLTSVKDLSRERDKIGVPSVKVSVPAIYVLWRDPAWREAPRGLERFQAIRLEHWVALGLIAVHGYLLVRVWCERKSRH